MSSRGTRLYLEDIRTSIRRIEQYTRGVSFDEFYRNHLMIDAVVRNLTIIGEAVKNIPTELKSKNPEVAWKEIKGMRNKVMHEYFGTDEEILWKTIQDDISVFKKQIARLLKDSKQKELK